MSKNDCGGGKNGTRKKEGERQKELVCVGAQGPDREGKITPPFILREMLMDACQLSVEKESGNTHAGRKELISMFEMKRKRQKGHYSSVSLAHGSARKTNPRQSPSALLNLLWLLHSTFVLSCSLPCVSVIYLLCDAVLLRNRKGVFVDNLI